MKRSVVFTTALALMLACYASGEIARAQGIPSQAQGQSKLIRNQPSQAQGHPNSMDSYGPPSGGPGYYSDEFAAEGFYPGDSSFGSCSSGSCGPGYCGSGECCDGSCNYGGYGCCDDCGYDCYGGCGDSWMDCLGLGQSSRWFFTADYLYVRASFSEAVAYLEQNTDDPDNLFDTFHELNFQHESSYRFGGGYKLDCCDEEVRFMYTRLQSGASAVAPIGSFVAYETTSPDSPTFINADVDAQSYDLDFRKTIPLGGTPCCGCGDACGESCDPCGCGDCCGCAPACPAWDITWSGGVRYADVDWGRHYATYDDGDIFTESNSTLNFKGFGPRVGLEGRRYFGSSHWCSAYLKGDISILLGRMQQQITRLDEDAFFTTQTARGRRIIPVTEIEAGLTARITSRSLFSAGYLFSAWHDLGFRDQFNFATQLEDLYDDANILGFDGFFARIEVGY
jgi:Legionella pneumophila major outer membrane protein precursor